LDLARVTTILPALLALGAAPSCSAPESTARDASLRADRCAHASRSAPESASQSIDRGAHRASATLVGEHGCLREYRLESTQPRRDAVPQSPRVVREHESAPRIRTGNVLFDALYGKRRSRPSTMVQRRIGRGSAHHRAV